MRMSYLLFKGVSITVITTMIVMSVNIVPVFSATLTSVSDALSSYYTGATATHSLSFTSATTNDLQEVHIQFSTTSGGSTKPANLSLTNVTLNSVNLFNHGGWSLDSSSASSGLIKITRAVKANVIAGTATSIGLQGVVNSAIDDCQSSNDVLQDTCHIRVITFADRGTTVVDSGTTTYTVIEDPTLSFTVSGVGSGITHNGITTNVSSTGTTFSFGNMRVGVVKYAAQKLSISTNAPHGFTVTAALNENMRGNYSGTEISPFGAINATWTTPQSWSSPDGDISSDDTGWFGANTTDTVVEGWESSTSGKFGPISTIGHIVAQSNGPQRTTKDVFVSYALEINASQPSDNYSCLITYNVQASY